jgi:hypothetical protein
MAGYEEHVSGHNLTHVEKGSRLWQEWRSTRRRSPSMPDTQIVTVRNAGPMVIKIL